MENLNFKKENKKLIEYEHWEKGTLKEEAGELNRVLQEFYDTELQECNKK